MGGRPGKLCQLTVSASSLLLISFTKDMVTHPLFASLSGKERHGVAMETRLLSNLRLGRFSDNWVYNGPLSRILEWWALLCQLAFKRVGSDLSGSASLRDRHWWNYFRAAGWLLAFFCWRRSARGGAWWSSRGVGIMFTLVMWVQLSVGAYTPLSTPQSILYIIVSTCICMWYGPLFLIWYEQHPVPAFACSHSHHVTRFTHTLFYAVVSLFCFAEDIIIPFFWTTLSIYISVTDVIVRK